MLKQLLNRITEIKWISKDCPAEAAFVRLELVFQFHLYRDTFYVAENR